ncbi:Catenin beta-1, partial [Geodia barretti]
MQEYERCQQSYRLLQDRRQRLIISIQNNPYHRNELESQLRVVERDMHQLQQQMAAYAPQPMMDHHQQQHHYHGYGPKGGGPYMSPGDSAIGSGVSSGLVSGVQSGVQTKAHSDVAPGDLEQLDSDEIPPQQQPQQQQSFGTHAVSSRMQQASAERIRMTMFPDTIEEGEEAPITQAGGATGQQQSNLHRLAQSTQVLKTAVASLTQYQGSTELTARALPEIAKLLQPQNGGDTSAVSEAAKLLHDLTKKETSYKAVLSNAHVVRTMVQGMVSTRSLDVQKSLAGCIHNMSGDRRGLQMIYNSGGIPCLVQLLISQVDAILFYAVTSLHNMLLHYEPAKMDVRLAGGLEKMVALLVKDNPKFLAITADCLHILAYGHQDSKLIILASGGPVNLVRIMRLYSYEKLLWTCSRLLKVLSVCPSNKPEIVQAGGMQALSRHLGHRSTRLVHNILHTLRNLSDMATKQVCFIITVYMYTSNTFTCTTVLYTCTALWATYNSRRCLNLSMSLSVAFILAF